MTLTIHYVHPFTWTLHSDLIDLYYLPSAHTSINIAHHAVARMEAFLPPSAVHVTCTTDNAANMLKAARLIHYGYEELKHDYYEDSSVVDVDDGSGLECVDITASV